MFHNIIPCHLFYYKSRKFEFTNPRLLKNLLYDKPNEKVLIFFATAYNKYGEGRQWKQERVRQFFADEELLIGQNYWNFVCNDHQGFNIVFEQYKKSARYIKQSLTKIKSLYFNDKEIKC